MRHVANRGGTRVGVGGYVQWLYEVPAEFVDDLSLKVTHGHRGFSAVVGDDEPLLSLQKGDSLQAARVPDRSPVHAVPMGVVEADFADVSGQEHASAHPAADAAGFVQVPVQWLVYHDFRLATGTEDLQSVILALAYRHLGE